MVLLDTNIVSEVIKADVDARVAHWLTRQLKDSLFLCAVTEAELRLGVAILPVGRRREALGMLIEGILSEDFAGRILPFDNQADIAYATVSAARRPGGKPDGRSLSPMPRSRRSPARATPPSRRATPTTSRVAASR